ncbi:hypothetical protein QEH59_18155 [Coraliomargarita sp. SDUM461004]|uniref:Uncharacterized protein n=1 Tax=Thalassobacterium sedimentorum TaxID=3041258 RepID=A0ABU1ANI6_9BACT|nr:hypothetical protein [Coraliomargarita sp. SDUM461004]MDQ8196359.1 hypothetical protein [Coraliomargarita sp. SDUM461004]
MKRRKESIWTKNLLHTKAGMFFSAFIMPVLAFGFGLYGIIEKKVRLRGFTYEGLDAQVLGAGIIFGAIGYSLIFTFSAKIDYQKRKVPMLFCFAVMFGAIMFSVGRNI